MCLHVVLRPEPTPEVRGQEWPHHRPGAARGTLGVVVACAPQHSSHRLVAIPGWTLLWAWGHSRGHGDIITVGTTMEQSPSIQVMICDEVPAAHCALKRLEMRPFGAGSG